MEQLQIYNTAAIVGQELRAELFQEFISFIGRGERTTKTYITNLKQFIAWLRYSHIVNPCRNDVISYRDYLTREHEAIRYDQENGWAYRTDASGHRFSVICSANTIKQYLQSVRQFFSWTAANGYYPNIAANIHAPKVRQDAHKKDALTAADVLTIEQSISLIAANKEKAAADAVKDTLGRMERATEQGKRIYAMYLLAVNCGLRTIEISRANVKDIETRGGISYLYVWGKGHAEADTKKTLAPEVKEAIDDYLKSRSDFYNGSSPLFVSTGNRSGGQRIASTTISKMLKAAMKNAGYDSERITAHSLRHTAGTNVQELTGNLYLTQQYMRHANPSTTEIYLHNNTEKQEIVIAQRLYDYYHGKNGAESSKQKLESLLQSLSPDQVEQLAHIAEAMAK